VGSTTWFWVTMWLATGTALGGIVTPVIAQGRRFSAWLAMLLGVVLGAIGNLILVIPLWLFVRARKVEPGAHLPWQRDDISAGELKKAMTAASSPPSGVAMFKPFRANLWPQTRVEGHSHRLTYVWVFVALAIITGIEVTLTYINPPFSITGPLVALSTTKVLLVALFFMHLRYDSRWYSALFAAAVPFAALIIAVLALSQ
jgi:cytochrome c oxidase subunit 4